MVIFFAFFYQHAIQIIFLSKVCATFGLCMGELELRNDRFDYDP